MSTTEPSLPVPEDDALDAAASAVVDGVATPEEADLAAAAPDGQARVATLRAVAEAVGRPVPDQGADAAARALAAATAAFDYEGAGDAHAQAGDGGRHATVSTLAQPAASGRWLPHLGAIAAVLMLIAGIGTLAVAVFGNRSQPTASSSKSGDASVAATAPGQADGLQESERRPGGVPVGRATAPEQAGPTQAAAPAQATPDQAAPAQGGAPGGAAPPGGPGPGGPPPPPVVDGGDFGNQTDVDALAQRAAAALDSAPDQATSGNAALPSDVQACVNVGAAGLKEKIGALRYRAVGVFQGRPVVVLVYDREGTPTRLLVVLTRGDCALVSFTEL